MAAKKRQRKLGSISHGRPKTVTKPPARVSSKATRTLIRSHHQLVKQHAQAVAKGDHAAAEKLQARIEEQGGLAQYQNASRIGQSSERGGDSSKLLMEWLRPLSESQSGSSKHSDGSPFRLLEVGALTKNNACSRSSLFHVTHIDLHAQEPEILEQDFMQRPLPLSDDERFDIISLSLVLNYVPDAPGRGDMLRRTVQFLRSSSSGTSATFPALFLVLPAPCVTNSRYLNQDRLSQIMKDLGYSKLQEKLSAKLIYYLWRYDGPQRGHPTKKYPKVEVNPGKTRNNFAIVLE